MYHERLRDLREYEGESQKDIAKLLGCHVNTYQKYEYGTSEFTASQALILAQFYNVSMDFLLGLTDKQGTFAIKKVDLLRRMRYLRKKKKLKQADIAKILFCKPLTYQRYETNIEKVPISTVVKLAQFYNVSTDILFGAAEVFTVI